MTNPRAILFLAAFSSTLAASAGERCSAVDGSSLRCGRELVRVEGVRAPALREPGGKQARQRLQERLQFGEVVIQRKGRDKYGYTLGRLFVGGKRISQIDVTPQSRTRR
jgi:endonuclease YncB( thermonuclease family)